MSAVLTQGLGVEHHIEIELLRRSWRAGAWIAPAAPDAEARGERSDVP